MKLRARPRSPATEPMPTMVKGASGLSFSNARIHAAPEVGHDRRIALRLERAPSRIAAAKRLRRHGRVLGGIKPPARREHGFLHIPEQVPRAFALVGEIERKRRAGQRK